MTRHRYDRRELFRDYLRAGAGVALTAVPLAIAGPGPVIGTILAALALLFGGYGLRAGCRAHAFICVDDQGIWAEGPFGAHVKWAELSELKLNYYTTKKESDTGWMHLRLQGAGRRLGFDSHLDGFGDIVGQAARAAFDRRLELHPTTAENLQSMGIDPEKDLAGGAMS